MNDNLNLQPSANTFAAILLASCLAFASAADAAIVYDNFAPTPPYYSNSGWSTGNFLPNVYAISATTFVPTGSGQLDELHLGLTNQKLIGSNNNLLTLYNDFGGAPGIALWSGNVTVSGVFGSVASLTGINGPTINSGQTYWLSAAPPVDQVTLHGWYFNTVGDLGPTLNFGTPATGGRRFALQVGVKAIPEPATWIIGLAAVAVAARSLHAWQRPR
jgi:hypothetical protein